jgi:galacturan 1,4-alpha-galacturonidase
MRFTTTIAAALLSSFAVAHRGTGHDVVPVSPHKNGKTCTVRALGNQTDDTPQILKAFKDCNHGGTVVFPKDQNYWIATRLNPVLYDVTIQWEGIWTMSDNLTYWRNNSYPIFFQNHHAGFVISGDRIHIDGSGGGGIHGNGNAWYNAEKKVTQPGRPMPFVFWNTSEVLVEHFFVKDSPLWALNIMNGTNMWFDDINCNSTALNAPWGTNWVQNTDGFDTMDANNIKLTNMFYQGGDDCIAIKPRSYNIFVQNITCHGGNGIAIGSLGQYLEDSSAVNVTVKDANILTYNLDMEDGAYIKTWVGALVPQSSYESAGQPRGGGWGIVENITFENFYIEGANIGMAISQNSGDNGSYAGTSKMLVSNVLFKNFTGYEYGAKGNRTASISCSKVNPCHDIVFEDINLAYSQNATATNATGTCTYNAVGGVVGMKGSGCS